MALISLIAAPDLGQTCSFILHLLLQQLSEIAVRPLVAGHHSMLSKSLTSKSHKHSSFPFGGEVTQDLGANEINVSKL